MDRVRKSLIVASVLTFFYGVYYWGIPAVINIDKRIDFIEQKIEQKTGYKINIEDPYIKMGHTPAIWFMAENISLLNDDGTKALQLDHSAIKIHFLPLLIGKLQIGNFSSDKIEANFVYTKDGELKLGQYKIDTKLPKSDFVLSKAYVRLGNYKVNLEDYKQNKHIILDGSYLSLDEFKLNKRMKMSTFAKLYVNKKASELMADIDIKLPINQITENQFKVKGRISNLDLADLSDYVKAFTQLESISGKINLIADTTTSQNKHKDIFAKISVEDLGIMQKEIARSIFCKHKIEVKTDISTIKNGLDIKNLRITSQGIDVEVNGKVKHLDAKMPHVDTVVKINPSRTENFIPLMPGEEDLIYEANLYALKKNPFYGDIKGELHLKGRADTPDVNGKITVTEGVLNHPLPYNTPKATIILDFLGTKMSMDVKVPAPINQMVYVTGTADLYEDRAADLMIKSTDTVDLKTAQIVLNPLHEILKFEMGPVPIMDIRGQGNIDLHVVGTRLHPKAWGQFNFKNTTASFLDIHNMLLTNGSGSLDFNDEDTHFYTTNALMNGNLITIDGKCSLYGNLDFDVRTQQDLGNLLKVIQTSPMLKDIQEFIKPITAASGKSDFVLKLTGVVKDVHDVVFNKNIFGKGEITLYSNNITAMKMHLSNVTGKINFENLNTEMDLSSILENSRIKVKGKLKDNNANLDIISDKFVLKDGLKIMNLNIPFKDDIGSIHTSFNAHYNGDIEKINPNGLNINGKIYHTKTQNLVIDNASFSINNSNLKSSPIKGSLKNSPFMFNISASNILSDRQSVNGNFDIQKFDLRTLNALNLRDFKDFAGEVNLKGQIKNNGLYSDIKLDGTNFLYNPEKVRVYITQGTLQARKDTLNLNKINMMLGEMPIFADGKISNLLTTPNLNVNLSAKPTQEFADQVFNNKAVYPIKIKGDVNLKSNITGTPNAIRNKTQLNLAENSSIYYMGATLGGEEPVNINIDNTIYPKGLRIHNFQYNKRLTQNNRMITQPQLSSSGYLEFLPNNDLKFDDFRVKTQEPTDAKIFNIIFRKPIMKQGIFTSDININGRLSAPKVLGKLHLTDIDMPLFDAKINDVDFDFKRDKVYLISKGKILNNNLNISSTIRNSTVTPYIFEDIKIHMENLDLNRIADALRDYDVDSSRNMATVTNASTIPDLSQVIIKKAEILADNIKIKDLNASDFVSHMSLSNKMILEVEDYIFKVAEGKVFGNIKYNLLNNLVNINLNAEKTNAQILAETLSDLRGQVYGSVDGKINIYCNGKTHDTCIQTLGGEGNFVVSNGRMPKLGSLEYLLKAGNLIKSGITGLTINGIIDLITPYKTGNFDSIKGNFHIKEGVADDIKIYSSGKALNIYIYGTYNLKNLIADMDIYGALTKDFSTLFGKISNASLNTLFNTIPGINLSDTPTMTEDIKQIPNIENATRAFKAEIYGDVNGSDYVKSFGWLK